MFDADIPFKANYETFKDLMAEKRGQKAAQDKLYYDFSEYAKQRAKFAKDPDALEWVIMFNTIGKVLEEKEQTDSEQRHIASEDVPMKEEDIEEIRSPLNLDKVSFQKETMTGELDKLEKEFEKELLDDDCSYSHRKNHKIEKESKEGSLNNIDFFALEKVKRKINSFIGLTDVKKETEDIISFAYLQRLRKERGLPTTNLCFNISFMGEPGTGKTTMAREYGKLFKSLGLLKKGHVVEVSRTDLIGTYIGDTELFTKNKFYEALDGVLFIDEAHNIYDPYSYYDYGQECLATLIKLMEDFRERVIVIFAGYEDQLKATLFRYEGMQSRIPHLINFKNYTPEELLLIFEKICDKYSFQLSQECRVVFLDFLKSQSRKSNKVWNGREIRNFFEKSLIRQARRLSKIADPDNNQLVTFTEEDLELSHKKTNDNVVYI